MKQQLIRLGWTKEKLRQRMAGCRLGIKEAKARGGPALNSYRLMFCELYLKYRAWERIISVN